MSIYYEDRGIKQVWIDGPTLLANAAYTDASSKWSKAASADVLSFDCAAAETSSYTFEGSLTRLLPLDELIGAKLVGIKLWYTVGVAALTATTFELHKVTPNATTNVPTGAAVAMAGGDTLLKTVATHIIELQPTSELIIEQDTAYNFEWVIDTADTSTVKVYGAWVEYTPAGQ